MDSTKPMNGWNLTTASKKLMVEERCHGCPVLSEVTIQDLADFFAAQTDEDKQRIRDAIGTHRKRVWLFPEPGNIRSVDGKILYSIGIAEGVPVVDSACATEWIYEAQAQKKRADESEERAKKSEAEAAHLRLTRFEYLRLLMLVRNGTSDKTSIDDLTEHTIAIKAPLEEETCPMCATRFLGSRHTVTVRFNGPHSPGVEIATEKDVP